jgi:ParB-like chromosome segregation protein Spo0J
VLVVSETHLRLDAFPARLSSSVSLIRSTSPGARTNRVQFQVHPAAGIFPSLEGAPFDDLVADIAQHGLLEPVVIDAHGLLLDGRNRVRACERANVAVRTRRYDGDHPLAFVLSANLHRRHLNESQIAMVLAPLTTLPRGRPNTAQAAITQTQAATLGNVSVDSVQRARKVLDRGTPELIEAVQRGNMTVKVAAAIVHLPPEKQQARIERDRLKASGEHRQKDDWYRTPAVTTEEMLQVEKFRKIILEPACGDGAISRVLEAHGYTVISRDLHDRGYGEGGHDFLKGTSLAAKDIVANFPFDAATDMTCHALDLGARKIAVLHRLAWLEGEERYGALFARRKLARLWSFSPRQTLWRGDLPAENDGGMTAYGWFIFERDHDGPYVGDWLPGAA